MTEECGNYINDLDQAFEENFWGYSSHKRHYQYGLILEIINRVGEGDFNSRDTSQGKIKYEIEKEIDDFKYKLSTCDRNVNITDRKYSFEKRSSCYIQGVIRKTKEKILKEEGALDALEEVISELHRYRVSTEKYIYEGQLLYIGEGVYADSAEKNRFDQIRLEMEQRKNTHRKELDRLNEELADQEIDLKIIENTEKQREEDRIREEKEYKRQAEEKARRAREKQQAEIKAQERLKKHEIEAQQAAEVERLQLERERLRIEEARRKRAEEAEAERQRQDHELKKLLLLKEIEEMKLKREQEDREGFANMTRELNHTPKDD